MTTPASPDRLAQIRASAVVGGASLTAATTAHADLLATAEAFHAERARADALAEEVERLLPCDAGCTEYPEEECSRHGRPVAEVWGMLVEAVNANTAARASLAALTADLRALCDDDTVPGTPEEWERRVRAILDRHAPDGADVPMSPDMGHDLRERIAQAVDQAWAEAKDRDRNDGGYRDGYIDGLEFAEGIVRSTPLTTDGGAP